MKNIKLFSRYIYIASHIASLFLLSNAALITAQSEPVIAPVQKPIIVSSTESPVLIESPTSQKQAQSSEATLSLTPTAHGNTDTNTNTNKITKPAPKIKQETEQEPLKKRVKKQINRLRNAAIDHLWGRGAFKQHYIRRASIVYIITLVILTQLNRAISTQLINAALTGNTDTVKTLLQITYYLPQFNINRIDHRNDDAHRGLSALHAASRHGHTNTVTLLLNNKADPNKTNQYRWTPIHEAACYYGGAHEIINQLLQAKANINALDNTGATPLIFASERNPVFVEILLEKKADPNIQDTRGNTALHYVALNHQNKSSNDMVNTANTLLKYGAYSLVRNNSGEHASDLASNDELKTLLQERESIEVAHQKRQVKRNGASLPSQVLGWARSLFPSSL